MLPHLGAPSRRSGAGRHDVLSERTSQLVRSAPLTADRLIYWLLQLLLLYLVVEMRIPYLPTYLNDNSALMG